jgi:small subunit ribosomal protein S7
MSRRRQAEKRVIKPDPVYNSEVLAKFINKIMQSGKKRLAEKIVYGALELLMSRVKADSPLAAFETAMENTMPELEVKSRRIGGATYQVPVEIPQNRKRSLAMKWIIQYSRAKPGRSMINALAQELQDCFNNQGSSIKKKEDTHRMAEANKAFAHFKW